MDADGEGPGRRSCYDDSDSDVGERPAQHMCRRRQGRRALSCQEGSSRVDDQ